jgi:flagellar hook-basal body protein
MRIRALPCLGWVLSVETIRDLTLNWGRPGRIKMAGRLVRNSYLAGKRDQGMDARSLWNGVAGVKAHAKAMHSVADNIANTNTVGYKSIRAEFGDILYSALNGGSAADNEAQQLGYGSLTQLVNIMGQGAIIQSESPLDLAIDGDGFFTVADPITPENIYYTRAGQFVINDENQLVNPKGYTLLGYTVVDGELNTDEIVNLEIDTGVLEGAATSVVELGINLNASDTRVFEQSVNIDPTNARSFNAALPINIYDDENTIRQMRIYFQRSGHTDTGTVWKAAVYEYLDGSAVPNPGFPDNVFYMQFDGDGALIGTASDAVLAQGDIYESGTSFPTSGGVVSTAAGESLTYTGDGVEQTYLTDSLLVFTLPTQAGDTITIGSDTFTSSGGSTAAESASELADAINADSSRTYYAIDNGAGEVRIVAKTASDLTFSGPISINPQVSTTLNQLVEDINTGAVSTGVVQLSDMAALGQHHHHRRRPQLHHNRPRRYNRGRAGFGPCLGYRFARGL